MKKWLLTVLTFGCLSTVFLQPLSGTYTLDPALPAGGTNFQTFSALASALTTNGVSTAVTVNVKEGTYLEQFSLGAITGTSVSNVVTIQSNPTNTNPVVLEYSSSSTTQATLTFSGTRYFTFNDITFKASGGSNSKNIYFATNSGSGDLYFNDCVFTAPPATSNSTNLAHVHGTTAGLNGEGLQFTNCSFEFNSYGIYVTGSSSARSTKLKVIDCDFVDHYGYTVYTTYFDSVFVMDNYAAPAQSTSTQYGIYCGNLTSSPGAYVRIEGNDLRMRANGSMYGIYVTYVGSSAANPSRIVNNMISNDNVGSTSLRYGIYPLACANFNIFHNSINILDGSGTSGRGMYINGSTSTSIPYTQGNYNIQNNIFVNTGQGYALEISGTYASLISNLNYNVYHGNPVNPLRNNGTNYNNLTVWNVATGFDANSELGDPIFANSNDLHVVGSLPNDAGNNAVGVTVDIDGDTRPMSPSTTVDIGADEYFVASCIPPNNISAANITNSSADISWTANNLEMQWFIEVVPTGQTPTGTGIQANTNPYTYGGLSGSTTYDVYVQADCGGGSTSTFTGPYTFTTECDPVVAPYMEPFTGTTDPPCWSQSATTGGPWVYTGDPGYTASGTLDHTTGSPNNYAWLDHSGNDEGVILQAPLIDVSALTSPQIRLWVWSHYNGTLGTYNPTFIEGFDGLVWQQIGMIQGDFGPQWTEFTYLIPASLINNGITQLRIRGESGGDGSDFYNDILIDDFWVVEAPTCLAVEDFEWIDGDTSSVVMTWTANNGETEWQFEYGAPGFSQGSGTYSSANSNPDSIVGLASNSFYQVYVRAVCTPGDSSFWEGPILVDTYGLGQFMEVENECHPQGFIDISDSVPAISLANDGEVGFNLPFTFYYQGTAVSQVTIGNNGVILFNTISGQVSPFNSNTIATTAAQGLYPFWDDLDDNNAQIYYKQVGTSPNSKFIVQWNAKHDFYNAGIPFIFQVVMEEATGEVYYTYFNTVTGSTAYDNGNSATIGLKGPNQNFPLSFNNPTYLDENQCVRFYYTKCPKPTDLVFQYITEDEAGISWTTGLSGETNWTVIYGPAGFNPDSSGVTQTVTNNSAVLVPLDQLTTYDVYVFSDCDNGNQSFALMGTFTTLPFCSNPTNLNANAAEDSIFTSWMWSESDPMYPSTGFEFTYGTLGFDPIAGGNIKLEDNIDFNDTIPDNTLMAGGVYDVYIRAMCDTLVSGYVGPVTVTMPLTNDDACGAQLLPVDGEVYVFNNTGATVQTNEQNIAPPVTGNQQTDGWGNNNLARTTWFKFVAPASGEMRIDATAVSYNGQVAVYETTTCSNFATYTLIGANDDDLGGLSLAPNFTLCGLTPGVEYFLMHDSFNTTTGNHALSLSSINLDAGNSTGVIDVCYEDTLNLFEGIANYQSGGTWIDTDGTFHITDDSLFYTSGLAYDVYNFEYRLTDGCATESSVTTVQVYGPSQAGIDGSLQICKNEAFSTLTALSGTIQTGGQWYDAGNAAIGGPFVSQGTLNTAGTYNYSYIVGNGVCPDDTSFVSVEVLSTCDALSLEEATANAFEVYPNPTNGQVQVNLGEASEGNLQVLDANGKLIEEINIAKGVSNVEVSLEGLDNGVYFLKISTAHINAVERIVKQ